MSDAFEDWWGGGAHGSERAALRGVGRAIAHDLLTELRLEDRWEMYTFHPVDEDLILEVVLIDGGSVLVTLDPATRKPQAHNPVGLLQKVQRQRRATSSGGRERSIKYSRRDERIRQKARRMQAANPSRYADRPARLRRDLLADWPDEWDKPLSDRRLREILRAT